MQEERVMTTPRVRGNGLLGAGLGLALALTPALAQAATAPAGTVAPTLLWISVGLGLVGGVLLAMLAGWRLMPGMMLHVWTSRYDTVEETVARLQESIVANGWQSPMVRDMNAAMAKNGVQHPKTVRIVELCRAEYADRVLMTNPEMATLMPCAFGVYEGANGKVCIAGMNTGLMGKLFGGTVAEVMGGSVAKDERAILAAVIAH